MPSMRGWLIPILIACVLHLLVISVLLMGWDASVEYKPVVVPRHIEARVVELKPKPAKVKPVKKPKKATVKKTPKIKPVKKKPPPKKVAKPVVTKKATPVKKEPLKPKVDEKKLAEQRRLQEEQRRLQELADSLAVEEQQKKLEQDQALEQIQVQSHMQKIRSDIESQWSRPLSARNGMEVTLSIQLVPSGELVNVQVVKRSGNDAFDESAARAVRKIEKFEVPKEYELFDRNFRKFTLFFRAEGLSR